MQEAMLSTAILDMRCLQDPGYAKRGIGRHVMSLLRHAPHTRVVGLVDPAMPALMAEAASLVETIVPNAYAAERLLDVAPRGAFVSLSPMTHPPEFVARLLTKPGIIRAAIVYDFIPKRFPHIYLPTAADKLNYALAKRWLARCDAFAPISQSAAADLRGELGVPADSIFVTGCSIAPIFLEGTDAASERKHVFVGAGPDGRKNPEVVIRAHAQSEVLQNQAIKLLIGGNYSNSEAQRFRDLAAQEGGNPDLIQVPGHVTDMQLRQMYREALVVMSASRDEGFSLPLVEGMSCGALCAASDIPAHQELVGDTGLRFAPDDHGQLMTILERAIREPEWRKAGVDRQKTVWPRFRESEVASRFWSMLKEPDSRPAAPAVNRGRRPRIAVLSPLPPDRSGVADYTAATCADLGRLVDLHLFTDTIAPRAQSGVSSIRPLTELPHLMSSFDRVVSVIGNSHFHHRIFEFHQRYGGACIAHDARMLGFYRIVLSSERALAEAARELGRPVHEAELNLWLSDESKLEALFLGEIIAASSPMVVHSPVTAELCAERYGVTPAYVPFSIYRPWSGTELSLSARRKARARIGVADSDVVISSFGFVSRPKAPEEMVLALEILRHQNVPARLHLVGDIGLADSSLLEMIERKGLSPHVRIWRGHVSEQDYRDHLAGSDLGVQLRTYGLGGLSGALLDCVAAGLPSVANEALVQAVGVPRGYTRSIPDDLDPRRLAEAMAELLDASTAPGARTLREQERTEFSHERSFAVYADKLCRTLGLDIGENRQLSRSAA